MKMPVRGLTLVEMLIVIVIVGVLVAVLIPNLLRAREQAFDTGTQACLKELATRQEAAKTAAPFEYDSTLDAATLASCNGVTFMVATVGPNTYAYEAKHYAGVNTYSVAPGTSVQVVR